MTPTRRDRFEPEGGWAGPPAPRLVPPPPEARTWTFRTAGALVRRFGRDDVPNVFAVLHLEPRLFWTWLAFASRLMPFGKLSAALREKVILRTAWNRRSRYEWAQHLDLALRAGVSDSELVRLTRPAVEASDATERAVLVACDQICAGDVVDEGTYAVLRAAFTDPRLVELLLLVGHYVMLAGFLNNAGVVLEPQFEEVLRAFEARVADQPEGGVA